MFSEDSLNELKPDGKILVNTKRHFNDSRVIAIDGDAFAAEILKLPITNTIMLGVFAAVFDEITVADLETAIKGYMPENLQQKNIPAIKAVAAVVGLNFGDDYLSMAAG